MQCGVQDTGVEILPEKLQSVFQKFECLQHTRNRVDKPVPGSGLGLNIVMNSIKAQGGTVWVESEMDKGSTFIFTLPVAPASQKTFVEKLPYPESASNGKQKELSAREAVIMVNKKAS